MQKFYHYFKNWTFNLTVKTVKLTGFFSKLKLNCRFNSFTQHPSAFSIHFERFSCPVNLRCTWIDGCFCCFYRFCCQDNIWLFCFDNCYQSITNIDWKFLFCFKFFLLNELFIYQINEKFESQVWNNPVILTEYLIFSRDVLFDFKGKNCNFRSIWK